MFSLRDLVRDQRRSSPCMVRGSGRAATRDGALDGAAVVAAGDAAPPTFLAGGCGACEIEGAASLGSGAGICVKASEPTVTYGVAFCCTSGGASRIKPN